MLRFAEPGDLTAILQLLTKAGLPAVGVAEFLDAFVVAESEDEIVGVGGLEIRGSVALLRSLAVSPAHRGRGFATTICDRLEAEGARRGVKHFYLLTETAEGFFAKRGFATVARDEAPPEIICSQEFSELCPESAVLMRRTV